MKRTPVSTQSRLKREAILQKDPIIVKRSLAEDWWRKSSGKP